MISHQDLCGWPRCNKPAALIYLDRGICADHWDRYAEDKKALRKGLKLMAEDPMRAPQEPEARFDSEAAAETQPPGNNESSSAEATPQTGEEEDTEMPAKKSTKKPGTKAASKSTRRPSANGNGNGVSRFELIRQAFKTRKKVEKDELMKITGWDGPNVSSAMSILRDKNRTSPDNLLPNTYDRESKSYLKG